MGDSGVAGGGGRGGGGKEEEDFVGHRRWAEDVDVIAVSNEHAPMAYQGLDKAKDGVESTLSLAAPLALMPTSNQSSSLRRRRLLPSFLSSTASFSPMIPAPMPRMSEIS